MRLDKALTYAGLTRTEAKRAIGSGRVRVNGIIVKRPEAALADGETLTLDGNEVLIKKALHIMINKPKGCLTATEDKTKPTVLDYIGDIPLKKELGPIGRLDKDVSGLVLLTTDGQLAHNVISPKHDIEKIYFAKVAGRLDSECQNAFKNGIEFKDFTAKPAILDIIEANDGFSLCRVHVSEGKYHQVKKMLLSTGHEVLTLKRERIGPIALDEALAEGMWRELTKDEETALYKSAGMEQDRLN